MKNINLIKLPMKIVILPPKGWSFPDFTEVLHYHELMYFFVYRDLKAKYKHTALGLAWAFIPPIFNMVLYTLLFGLLAKLPSEGLPYVLFLVTGQTAWGTFSNCFSSIANSMRMAASQTTKVYFPRLIVPLYSVVVSFINSLPGYVVLVILMVWFQVPIRWQFLTLPFFILLSMITAFGVGLWITSLSIKYRDVENIQGMLIQAWLYASPVVYTPQMLPDGLIKDLYWFNPMAVVTQGYRYALLGSDPVPMMNLVIATILVILLLISGLIYFHQVEQTVIDLM